MLAAGHFMVLDVEGNATLCCASVASRANTIGNYLTMPIKAIQAARRSHPLTDRDTTLITLNALLTPDHEIRFCRETNGNDTVAFLPLPSAQWQSLETAFPKEVEAKFMKITADTQCLVSDRPIPLCAVRPSPHLQGGLRATDSQSRVYPPGDGKCPDYRLKGDLDGLW